MLKKLSSLHNSYKYYPLEKKNTHTINNNIAKNNDCADIFSHSTKNFD